MTIKLTEKQMNNDQVTNNYTPIIPSGRLKRVAYPCDKHTIGDIAEIIETISNVTKKDNAMVAQAVISTLAGAAQLKYQVSYFDDVGSRPLSLFVLTIAKSARGKSHVSKLCNKSLKAIEAREMKTHQREMAEYKRALKSKGENDTIEPTNPKFIFNSGTIEGMIDVIARNGYCYALIDELAILLGGHSAKPENLGKLIGTLSSLWSDGEYSEVKRGNDDPRQVNGDLTFSANGQPDIVKPMFNNPVWREQGTIPRFLVCEPTHIKHKRIKGEKINPQDKQLIDDFNDTIHRIFDVLPCTEGKYTVWADEQAEGVLTDFYNEMQDKSETVYADIESYAMRATEHAGRLAGLITVYHAFNRDLEHKGGDITMTQSEAFAGVALMRYYLHEYQRLSTGDFGIDIAETALSLFDEMNNDPDKWQSKDKGYVSQTAYTRNIGRFNGSKAKLKADAFSMLLEHGYLIPTHWTDNTGRKLIHYKINDVSIPNNEELEELVNS